MSESLNRQEPHTRNHESPRGSYNLTPLSRVTAPRAIHDFHFFLLRLRLRLVLLPISSSSRSPVLDPSLADPPLSTSIAHFSHQHHPTGTPFRHCHQQDLSNTLKSDPPFSPAKSSPPPLRQIQVSSKRLIASHAHPLATFTHPSALAFVSARPHTKPTSRRSPNFTRLPSLSP